MCHFSPSSAFDLLDLDRGISLSVSLCAAIALASVELVNLNLLSSELTTDSCRYLCTLYIRSAKFSGITIDDSQNLLNLIGRTLFHIESIDNQFLAFFCLILLAKDFNSCVHFVSFEFSLQLF